MFEVATILCITVIIVGSFLVKIANEEANARKEHKKFMNKEKEHDT